MQVKSLAIATASLVLGIGIGLSSPNAQAQQQLTHQQTVADFPDLGAGLKATPGCLDVKSTAFNDGKTLAIFAWFENKAAVNAWYNSKMHREAMKTFFPNMPGAPQALSGFKDEKSPLLVVATVTPSDSPKVPGSQLAVSQIAIEIYTPVPGGVTMNGGFGPESLKVPGLRRMK
jgi:hypothetical protein